MLVDGRTLTKHVGGWQDTDKSIPVDVQDGGTPANHAAWTFRGRAEEHVRCATALKAGIYSYSLKEGVPVNAAVGNIHSSTDNVCLPHRTSQSSTLQSCNE